MVRTFKDLIAWQRAFDLSLTIHQLAEGLPADQRFGLSSELMKTSRSVVYNIAEGHQRGSTREFLRFIDISLGSQAELETQILLAVSLGYVETQASRSVLATCDEVGRLLRGLSRSLRDRNLTP